MARHRLTFQVKPSQAGTRLDDFLIAHLPAELERLGADSAVSKSKVRRLVMAGMVQVDQRPVRVATMSLDPRIRIVVQLDTERFSFEKEPDDIAFELDESRILYEDEWLIVINKPAGLPTEATMVASRDHLHAAVIRYLAAKQGVAVPYLALHHRLDRDTSGVILFSRHVDANPGLHRAFADHTARKTYHALCTLPRNPQNWPQGKEFSVDNKLGRISPKSAAAKWGAVTDGQHAHTDFSIIMRNRMLLQVQAKPLTGRTHQIRVHLAGLGLPLLGDKLYGGSCCADTRSVDRVMLHALNLTIPHPISGKELSISAPLPPDFMALTKIAGS